MLVRLVLSLCLLAALALPRALGEGTARALLVAGVCFGLAQLSKFTAVLLVPVVVALALGYAWRARSWKPVGRALLVGWLGFGVVAIGYRFESRSVFEAWAGRYEVRSRDPQPFEPVGVEAILQRVEASVARAGLPAGAVEARLVSARVQATRGALFLELVSKEQCSKCKDCTPGGQSGAREREPQSDKGGQPTTKGGGSEH